MTMDVISNIEGMGGGGTLPEQIAGRIGGLIEAGGLRPGSRLPSERELARTFTVSRLAVREAYHRLEARGLITVRRGAGSFVSAVVPTEVRSRLQVPVRIDDELAAMRMLIEPAAADWAARRADETSVRVLRRLTNRFDRAAADEEPRYDLLAAADVELHLEIARCAENALLLSFVDQLQVLSRLQLEQSLGRPGRLARTAAEHRALVDAVASGDPEAARRAMVAHLTGAAATLRDTDDGAGVLD
jgi:DNA-binding FadR family transcriptional regulator